MFTPSPYFRLRQKLHLKQYLAELSVLTGHPVSADELGSIEQAAAMRLAAQGEGSQYSVRLEIKFADISSVRFSKFLQRLSDANPSNIYVWTPRTIDCGALLVPSLDAIKFDFDFTINDEGILAFTTRDLRDCLLLDFSIATTGGQVMTVETRGANWSKTVY